MGRSPFSLKANSVYVSQELSAISGRRKFVTVFTRTYPSPEPASAFPQYLRSISNIIA